MLIELSFLPIRIAAPKGVLQKFVKRAKKDFPNEVYAYVLGHDAGTNVEIVEFYFPPQKAETGSVQPLEDYAAAAEYAAEHDLQLLGDIHSHPYVAEEGETLTRAILPSIYDYPYKGICGICGIVEKKGRLLARVQFWGPIIPTELVSS